MERLRRLARFWNWLPAFRAVAETEHLPSASERFLVSAPALSRAVRLLEADLGHRLFKRAGRGIELTDEGHRFLAVVRNAMRLVHEGLLDLDKTTFEGPVYVASDGAITTAYVIPAVEELRAVHPGLLPILVSPPPDEVVPQLLRGALDVSFFNTPIDHPQLSSTRLGAVPCGVYCGIGHPLYEVPAPCLDEIVEHTFVAPPIGPAGFVDDGWPTTKVRRFGLHVDQMRIGAEVCASGSQLAVLADPVAARLPGLRKLPTAVVPDAEVFATRRSNIGVPTRTDVVVEAVQKRITGRG